MEIQQIENTKKKELEEEDISIHSRLVTLNANDYKKEVKSLLERHKILESSYDNTDFHKTKMVIKYGSSKELSVSYFGSQGRFYVEFLKEYFDKILKFTPNYFVETPGGSNSNSYGMVKLGIKNIITNDLSYWSWCIAEGILKSSEIITPEELDIILKSEDEGYLIKERNDLPILTDTKKCIDGMIKFINENDNPKYKRVLAVIGKFMLSNFTFRSMTWDKKRMQDSYYGSKGVMCNYITKYIEIFNNYSQINKGNVECFNEDHLSFLKKLTLPKKGSVLYCDFDWPWVTGKETEVYTWYIKDISSILLGKKIEPNIKFWTKENIKDELLKVLQEGVNKFEYVFLSTQSSNYPNIEELKKWVEEIVVIKDYCFIDTPSLVANKNFREELLVLQGKNVE